MLNLMRWGLPALTAALLGTSVYNVADLAHERRKTQDLSATNADLRSSLARMQNQLQAVSDRLNQLPTQAPAAVEPEPAPRPSAFVETARPAVRVRPKIRVVADAKPAVPKEDPRWTDFQSRLNDQQ